MFGNHVSLSTSSSRPDKTCGVPTVLFNIAAVCTVCGEYADFQGWRRMHIHMLSSQKQSGKTAVYITFGISHQLWQKRILHCNKICVMCTLLLLVCTGLCIHA